MEYRMNISQGLLPALGQVNKLIAIEAAVKVYHNEVMPKRANRWHKWKPSTSLIIKIIILLHLSPLKSNTIICIHVLYFISFICVLLNRKSPFVPYSQFCVCGRNCLIFLNLSHDYLRFFISYRNEYQFKALRVQISVPPLPTPPALLPLPYYLY